MAKIKSAFFCQNCGKESAKWLGKCPNCNEWNTFVEEIVTKESKKDKLLLGDSFKKNTKPHHISEVKPLENKRYKLSNNEFNRVLGGGIVVGSLILIGGEPGIGKSTLLLDVALNSGLKVLYVSGEESEEQIKMRADRISHSATDCFLLTETNTQYIFQHTRDLEPDLLIIDSIQTLHTSTIDASPGSVSQVRECTAEMMRYAKETGTPIMLIGHITKDGAIAGPKVLEHMVDTVLQFEGDRNHLYRLLRSVKNRFGSTNELGIYEMTGEGLREVENPSEIMITQNNGELSGVAIAVTMEGTRPLLIEVQALASTAAYGTPQRSATGFDLRRLNMLLAVLEKKCGFKISQKDVFLNITGGIKVDDPAIDLAVVCAILSSNVDLGIDAQTCFAGEVGLSGEIRPVPRIKYRISEAEKLGYKRMFLSKHNKDILQKDHRIKLVFVDKVEDVLRELFS